MARTLPRLLVPSTPFTPYIAYMPYPNPIPIQHVHLQDSHLLSGLLPLELELLLDDPPDPAADEEPLEQNTNPAFFISSS